jgi:predicted Na+-dependent transporter
MPEHICILLTCVAVISFSSGVRLLEDVKTEHIHWIAESSGMTIYQFILMNVIYILNKFLMNQQTAKSLEAESVRPNDAF